MTVTVNPKELGHNGAATETRTHGAIDPTTWTSLEGQLFQTRGLEFTHCSEKKLSEAKRLALAIHIDDHPFVQRIKGGLAPLGGERRIVAWRESSKTLPNECLGEIRENVANDKACRIVLLTPGCFVEGSRPTWLLSQQHGLTVELKAIANGRTKVISGWDLEYYEKRNGKVIRGRPKPTRRLAPAGSVYFLKLEGEQADLRTWVERMWMHCVSDEEQERRDGFGLATVGVWNGKPSSMEF